MVYFLTGLILLMVYLLTGLILLLESRDSKLLQWLLLKLHRTIVVVPQKDSIFYMVFQEYSDKGHLIRNLIGDLRVNNIWRYSHHHQNNGL